MNRHIVSILALLLSVLLLFWFTGCSSKDDRKGKGSLKAEVTISNGTKIIKNPSAPLHGELKLELEETLTIGHGEKDFFSSWPFQVDVDKNDNIYVLDYKENCFKIFNSNGKFLRKVGQFGEGPQDLYEPIRLQVDLTGKIYVMDNLKNLRVFNFNGELSQMFQIISSFESSVAPDGNIIYMKSGRDKYRVNQKLSIVKAKPDVGGSFVKSYIEKTKKYPSVPIPDGGILLFFCHFDHNICYYLSKSGNLYVGDNSEYRILVYDQNDHLIREIRRDEKPVPITNEEKDFVIWESYPSDIPGNIKSKYKELIADYKPFFTALRVDEKEWLYVFKRYSKKLDDMPEVDIFDATGQYIYHTRMPRVPLLVYGGCFYYIIEETEDYVVKKVKMKNL